MSSNSIDNNNNKSNKVTFNKLFSTKSLSLSQKYSYTS